VADCREISENLIETLEQAVSGSLSPDREEHLKNCARCRGLVETYRPLFARISYRESAAPPESVWRHLQERVVSHEEIRQNGIYHLPNWRRTVVVAVKSFSIAAAAIFGIYLGNLPANGQSADLQIVDEYGYLLGDSTFSDLSDAYFDLNLDANGGEL
jgi:predicted anti-sigma-YlaC factor YlaD